MMPTRFKVVLALAMVCIVGAARGSETRLSSTYEIKIAAQPLASALLEFSAQTRLQIMTLGADVRELRTKGFSGHMTVREGLEKLLAGSGLSFKLMGDSTVGLIRESKPSTSTAIEDERGAFAAEAIEARERESDGTVPELEEIVVTAQKRRERLIDVPQSVSVLSGETLTRMGATQLRDFADTVPGLTFTTTGGGNTQLSMRGVSIGFDSSPTVAVYVDEVPYGSSSSFALGVRLALDMALFDIDRIEVLRGPQGTFYGASAMGGLIKYVAKRPDSTAFGIDVRSGLSGTRDGGISYNAAGALNVPIAPEKAALRVSSFYSRDGGYIDNLGRAENDVNDSDVYGGRVDFVLSPTQQLGIQLTGFAQNIFRDGTGTANYTRAGAVIDGELDQRRLAAEPFGQRFRLGSGTITYDFGPVALISISSYQTVESGYSVDSSRFVGAFQALSGRTLRSVGGPASFSTDKFTQEVRLASDGERAVGWVFGGFYTHEDASNLSAFDARDPAGNLVPVDFSTTSLLTRLAEYAAFTNITWRLNRQLALSGGIRYANNRQRFEQTTTGLLGGVTTPAPLRSDEDVFTYLATLGYHFTDSAVGYLRYSTGYRPGGPNIVSIDSATQSPLAPATFEADRLRSYEGGFKAESPGRRFGIDLAAYYIDWTDMQISTPRGAAFVLLNAPGGATIRGSELALTARPLEQLAVTGAFAYQDARMSQANTDLRARKGERLPNTPRLTAALSTDYELPVESLRPTIGTTLRFISDRNASFAGSTSFPQYHLPEYAMVDLRTGLTLGAANLQLYVHNLFDRRGQLSAVTFQGPAAKIALTQPRTFGITATARF